MYTFFVCAFGLVLSLVLCATSYIWGHPHYGDSFGCTAFVFFFLMLLSGIEAEDRGDFK